MLTWKYNVNIIEIRKLKKLIKFPKYKGEM